MVLQSSNLILHLSMDIHWKIAEMQFWGKWFLIHLELLATEIVGDMSLFIDWWADKQTYGWVGIGGRKDG